MVCIFRAAADVGSIQHPIISSATAVSVASGQVPLHTTGSGLDLIRSYLLGVQLVPRVPGHVL